MSRSPLLLCLVLLAAALTTGGCTDFDLLDAAVPDCGYVRTRDVSYGPLPRQKLDVYRPTRPVPAAPPGTGGRSSARAGARVVVFFHGGAWRAGDKDDYRFVGQALASRGFVVVLPNYRLYPLASFPAFVEDAALAVRWARDNAAQFGGDPDHLYLMGHSAGAHIGALLTLDGRYLQAVGLDRSALRGTAALSGPYDFDPAPDDRALFGMKQTDAAPPVRIEPIRFVDGREPPMLLIHGLKDKVVGPEQAERLAERIRAAGGEVRLIEYPDRAHVGVVLALAWPFRWLAPVLDDCTAFFRSVPG
jgi:acetyl esterase/lipase